MSEVTSKAGERVWETLGDHVPGLRDHPKLLGALALGTGIAGMKMYLENRWREQVSRASRLKSNIRVVKQHPSELLAHLLDQLFERTDTVDTIRCDSSH